MTDAERTLDTQLRDHLVDLDECLKWAHASMERGETEDAAAYAAIAQAEAAAVHAKIAAGNFLGTTDPEPTVAAP